MKEEEILHRKHYHHILFSIFLGNVIESTHIYQGPMMSSFTVFLFMFFLDSNLRTLEHRQLSNSSATSQEKGKTVLNRLENELKTNDKLREVVEVTSLFALYNPPKQISDMDHYNYIALTKAVVKKRAINHALPLPQVLQRSFLYTTLPCRIYYKIVVSSNSGTEFQISGKKSNANSTQVMVCSGEFLGLLITNLKSEFEPTKLMIQFR